MTTVAQLLGHKPSAIFSVTPDAPVLEAIRLMAEHSVGALLVMRGEQLAGIVSERDYARKVILKGRSSSDTLVGQIMTADVITVAPGFSTQRIATFNACTPDAVTTISESGSTVTLCVC